MRSVTRTLSALATVCLAALATILAASSTHADTASTTGTSTTTGTATTGTATTGTATIGTATTGTATIGTGPKKSRQLQQTEQRQRKEAEAEIERIRAAAEKLVAKKLAVKQLAAKQLADKKKKLAAEAAKRADAARRRAVSQYYARNRFPAATRDPDDDQERLLILTADGPLLVELKISIQGRPYRHLREDYVANVIKQSDADANGTLTWDEAVASPFFGSGRFLNANAASKKSIVNQMDANRDGNVDKLEARRATATYGGALFTLVASANVATQSAYYGYSRGTMPANLAKMLDEDRDGNLSGEELSAAAGRLKSRDSDDNDIVDLRELADTVATPTAVVRRSITPSGAFTRAMPAVAYDVRIKSTRPALLAALQQKYGKNKKLQTAQLGLARKLGERLDSNNNGQIELQELSGLQAAEPHLRLLVRFATTQPKLELQIVDTKGVNAQAMSTGNSLSLKLPTTVIQLSWRENTAVRNYKSTADLLIGRMDKDNNKYLDKNEMTGSYARQFAAWDTDRDGKIYGKEIEEYYVRLQAPSMHRVTASVRKADNVIFTMLDRDSDGRLGLREIQNATASLLRYDVDKDGALSGNELPRTVKLDLSRGGTTGAYQQLIVANGRRPAASSRRVSQGPAWFDRMDRNRDGDVTRREFPGTEQQFKQLDTNADGFIDSKEAKAAAGTGRR